jgi:two-component system, cell cycle sensor histidine kinase and response regulator CckA
MTQHQDLHNGTKGGMRRDSTHPTQRSESIPTAAYSILDAVPIACFCSDIDGKFRYGNKAFLQFVGGDQERLKDNIYRILSPESVALHQQIDKNLLIQGGEVAVEGEAAAADGTKRAVVFKKSLMRDADGEPCGVMTSLVDLSALQKVKKALDESESEKQAILDGFPGILALFDPQMHAIWANDTVRRICADPIGKSCHQIFCRRNSSCDTACAVFHSIQTGQVEVGVKSSNIFSENGEEQMYEMTGAPVRNSLGEVTGVVVMAQNVSERYKLEKQLRHTQKMEAIGTLAGGIAHDFNNVLTPIMGYSEIIRLKMRQEGNADPAILDYLDAILRAAKRAKSLVEQILTFSRSSEKKELLQYIHPIIKEVMRLMRVTLPTTIQIRQEIDEQCGMVSVDPVQIHQILINLCTNSAHAMAGKQGTLTVKLARAERDEAGKDWLELSVADTGCGIKPELLDRIFEPYFTTKEKSRGTGMGLAMVHGIISRQGGRISVESQVGVGTVFRVFLPLLSEKTLLEQIVTVREIPRGTERILLVDDEEAVVQVTGQMLGSLGYQVISRTSAFEAVELFAGSSREIDLLITDLTMPDLTGVELSKQCKVIRPDLPVILFTGYSEQFSRDAATQAGVNEYCTKPLSLRDLATVVRRVLDSGGGNLH